MAEAAAHIRLHTGIEIGDEKRNPTTELSFGPLRPVQRLLRDRYAKLVPARHRTRIREAMTRAGLYREVAAERFIDQDGHVDRFIRDYYARDFEIYEQAIRQPRAKAA